MADAVPDPDGPEPDLPAPAERADAAGRDDAEDPDDAAAPAVGAPAAAAATRLAPPDDGRGDVIIRTSWGGTALYVAVAVAALAAVSAFQVAVLVVCVALFVAGLLAFAAAYVIAISRSREVEIGMGGLYFLAGTAPRRVQLHLLGSFGVEVLVATVTSSVALALVPADANNPLAFGFLVPMYGLGLAGLWGARYGSFGPRRSTDSGASVSAE